MLCSSVQGATETFMREGRTEDFTRRGTRMYICCLSPNTPHPHSWGPCLHRTPTRALQPGTSWETHHRCVLCSLWKPRSFAGYVVSCSEGQRDGAGDVCGYSYCGRYRGTWYWLWWCCSPQSPRGHHTRSAISTGERKCKEQCYSPLKDWCLSISVSASGVV